MVRKAFVVMAFVGIVLVLAACQARTETTPAAKGEVEEELSADQILTLGDVSSDPAGTVEEFQPLADYLAARLDEQGIRQGRVLVAPDLETMVKYLETGQVDLYFDSPYPALETYEQIGALPLLRRWKGGVGEYHTVIVVRQDGNVTGLQGLLGQMVAFDEPVSTSGYLLPKAHLIELGYAVKEKDTTDSSVAADEIGYVFAGDEENVLAWVLEGKVVGGMIPSSDFEELDDSVRNRLLVLDRTVSVPRHIALAQPGMSAELRSRIVELLLGLDEASDGKAVLAAFEGTSQFDELPLGVEETIQSWQQLFSSVR